MEERLPSWITLAGLLLPALLLVLSHRPRNLATLAYLLVIAGLCLIAGLLLAALCIRLFAPAGQPLPAAILVLVGALLALGVRHFWRRRLKSD